MKSILVTGGAGFIGANFLLYFQAKYPDYRLVNFDRLTYAADPGRLKPLENNPNYSFVQGDVADQRTVEEVFEKFSITDVIHFAAESHVDNSIHDPGIFIESNIKGTYTLLNIARSFWLESPGKVRAGFESSRFHHISTDEVYGALGAEGFFTEETPYAPNSPYSASKASSDMLVRSYNRTYGLNTVITNCSNNYGPGQHKEKLIPTVIRKAIGGEPIPVYGQGLNVRDWLYVDDHCNAIDLVFHAGRAGRTYNVGGDCEMRNIDLVTTICSILDNVRPLSSGKAYAEQIAYVNDRPGHDFRYAVKFDRINQELGWKPAMTIEAGLARTVQWYLNQ